MLSQMPAIAYKHQLRKSCKTLLSRIGLFARLNQVQHVCNSSTGQTCFLIHYISGTITYKRDKRYLG